MQPCASVQAPTAAEVFPIMWIVLEMDKQSIKFCNFLCLMLLNAEENDNKLSFCYDILPFYFIIPKKKARLFG